MKNSMCVAIWLIALGVATFPQGAAKAGPLIGPGQDAFDREVGQITAARRTINFEFFRPPGHAESTSLPLVVFLHGFSDGVPAKQARLNDTMRGLVHTTQRDNASRLGADSDLAAQFDDEFAAYLLVPKIPLVRSWSEHRNVVRQLIIDTADSYALDERRIYLTGFSDGGFATIDMLEQFPDVFAAGVPISGGGQVASADIEALASVPLWFFHGSEDFVVSPNLSIDLADAVNAEGGNARLSLPFGGHNAGYETAFRDRTQEFYPWMFGQSLPIPEPSTLLLAAFAGLALMLRSRA